MLYLLVSIINLIYGVLSFWSLLKDPSIPGYSIVFTISSILTILGLVGLFLWIKSLITSTQTKPLEDEVTKSWFNLTKSFDIVLILGIVFRIFIMQPFVVEGSSMEPNFHNQQILLVDKISYRFEEPKRGEVVIFKAPNSPADDYIKRIIGLPGETVRIEKNKIYINDEELTQNYLPNDINTYIHGDPYSTEFITLKEDQYFVLGDNREHSSDSREWGPMPKNNLIGKPFFSVYPFNEIGLIKSPEIGFYNSNFSLKSFRFISQY